MPASTEVPTLAPSHGVTFANTKSPRDETANPPRSPHIAALASSSSGDPGENAHSTCPLYSPNPHKLPAACTHTRSPTTIMVVGVKFATGGAGVSPASGADIAIYAAAGERLATGTFTQRAVLDTLAADRTPPYRKLDLAYLHDYLLNELVTKQALGGTAPTIQYTHSADEAAQLARETSGIAFITKPCSMADLKSVGDAGDLMPQKSTFFYPKLATGLVVNPLE